MPEVDLAGRLGVGWPTPITVIPIPIPIQVARESVKTKLVNTS
jgi:hypothetical protein